MDNLMSKVLANTTWTGLELWFFKVSVFSVGILFGAYFPAFFQSIMPILAIIGVVGSIYLANLWFKKLNTP